MLMAENPSPGPMPLADDIRPEPERHRQRLQRCRQLFESLTEAPRPEGLPP